MMQFHAPVAQLPGESDAFCDCEFSDRARVGERRVEDGDAGACGVDEVDLIRADAKTADNDEILGLAEDALGELGFGADTDDVDVAVTMGERSSASLSNARKRAYRIFSISCSSGNEVLSASTW